MKYILLILLSFSAYAQDDFVTKQEYPFIYLGKEYKPTLEWDEYELMTCKHDTRLWQGKDYTKSPCNWSAKIVKQLEQWNQRPYKTDIYWNMFLKTFVESIDFAQSNGQTPFETLTNLQGNDVDHQRLLESLIYFSQSEPKPANTKEPLPSTPSCNSWGNEVWSDRYQKCVCKSGYSRNSQTGNCEKESKASDRF